MNLGWLKGLLGLVAPAETIAQAVNPALSASVTLAEINTGVSALLAVLPELQACVNSHFRDLGEDATLVEALATDVSKMVPAVSAVSMTVADVAGLIVLMCNLGLIQTSTVPTKPAIVDGINPYSGAALGV
jgi:hypothetical protein